MQLANYAFALDRRKGGDKPNMQPLHRDSAIYLTIAVLPGK